MEGQRPYLIPKLIANVDMRTSSPMRVLVLGINTDLVDGLLSDVFNFADDTLFCVDDVISTATRQTLAKHGTDQRLRLHQSATASLLAELPLGGWPATFDLAVIDLSRQNRAADAALFNTACEDAWPHVKSGGRMLLVDLLRSGSGREAATGTFFAANPHSRLWQGGGSVLIGKP